METGFYVESEGFEPPDLLQSAVFKTAAIDHSASSLWSVNSEQVSMSEHNNCSLLTDNCSLKM